MDLYPFYNELPTSAVWWMTTLRGLLVMNLYAFYNKEGTCLRGLLHMNSYRFCI